MQDDGLPRQRAAIRTYAKSNALVIARDRPAFADMLRTLHANGVRTVIVEKLDRLARDLMVQEAALSYFQQHGFTIISVSEPDLMANDPSRIAFRQMMGVLAQYDKSMIVLKLAGARARKRAKEGRCEGRKPFGYYPGEKNALARIMTLRNEGLGFDRIAARLNAEGVSSRSGKPWHGFTINGILTRQGRAVPR